MLITPPCSPIRITPSHNDKAPVKPMLILKAASADSKSTVHHVGKHVGVAHKNHFYQSNNERNDEKANPNII